jgi:hypothetical protein
MLLVAAIAAATALAANVHLKGGRNAEPTFTDQGLALRSTGALAGLGNGDLEITLTVTGDATSTCTNPGTGGNQPPGQNPAEVTLSGSQLIDEDDITKNGSATFNLSTDAPQTPVPGAPGCPNPQWTQDITDVAFKSATIVVEQPPGTVVLTVQCTFSSPTSNGSVPRGNVSCTSS